MMNFKYPITIIIVLECLIFTSCKKKLSNPLLGEWQVDSAYYISYYKIPSGIFVNNHKKINYTDSNRTIIFEDNLMWNSYNGSIKSNEFGTYFPDKNEIIHLGLPHLYTIEGNNLHIYNYNYKNDTKLDIDTSEIWLRKK